MELTNRESLLKMVDEVEAERKRLQGWAFKPELKDSQFHKTHIFRCRRLAKIRENLRELAETYE